MPAEVLYYVHHHGGGHLARARAICSEFPGPVTLLSSLPAPEDLSGWAGRPSGARRSWVRLPLDTWDEAAGYRDPDAGGRLHWAPLHQPGLQDRNAAILRTISRVRPALLVADVSVEVTALTRLSGVPVVMVLLPGERTDPAHRLALDLATAVLAPWPRPRPFPAWLRPWESKIHFTGGVHAGPGRATSPSSAVGARRTALGPLSAVGARRTALVAFGAGGPPAMPAAAPGWRWILPDAAAPPGVWGARLAAADVVVAHAGLGTVGDLAAARARAVILPQERPFGEQLATGDLLRQLGVGPVVERWPVADDWPGLLDRAMTSAPAWDGWGVQGGASAAARLLADVAR